MNDRLTADESEILTAELATLSQAGLPLDSALRAAADELGRSRVAEVMREMAASLEQGRSLPDVMNAQAGRLPRFLGGVVFAAARTDRLDIMLPALVEQLEYQREQSRRLRGALAYPLLIILLVAILYISAAIFVVGPVLDAIGEFELTVPAHLTFITWWGKRGVYYFLASLPLLAVMAGVVRLAMGPANWGLTLTRVPLVGPAWHWAAASRMARHLALLLQLGERMPAALRLTALGVADANVSAACLRMADDVEQGHSLSRSLAAGGRLPAVLTPLVQAGEQSGTLAEAFQSAATLLDQWVMIRAALLRQVLPPMIFVLVAVVILSLFSTVMMPLVQLINNLS